MFVDKDSLKKGTLFQNHCLNNVSDKQKRKIKNRLNDLDSKTWLRFQKSWFLCDERTFFNDFILFFTKLYTKSKKKSLVLSCFNNKEKIRKACQETKRIFVDGDKEILLKNSIDYCILDLRKLAISNINIVKITKKIYPKINKIVESLKNNAYLTIFIKNIYCNGIMYPFAWEFARWLSEEITLKDEKIACIGNPNIKKGKQAIIFYCLNFRKEAFNLNNNSNNKIFIDSIINKNFFMSNVVLKPWFILRPSAREKGVLLHPAKFPEEMVQDFLNYFTKPGDVVLDPMAGTGSTLIACLENNRNSFGIELNNKYAKITEERIQSISQPLQKDFFSINKSKANAIIIQGDARNLEQYEEIPNRIDYCITSPPYWDMLRMKGAQTQAVRKEQGLDVSYSEDEKDLGNISDYEGFLDILKEIYYKVYDKLKLGGFLTIILKNVKKKGVIYPLAWDLTDRLSKKYTILQESIWCQDDIKLAPYGFGNAWVSNTFHHYCLNFKKEIL